MEIEPVISLTGAGEAEAIASQDEDPTNVLLLLVLFPGRAFDCLILGVIRAQQTERARAIATNAS
jgi:hypothetical protein